MFRKPSLETSNRVVSPRSSRPVARLVPGGSSELECGVIRNSTNSIISVRPSLRRRAIESE